MGAVPFLASAAVAAQDVPLGRVYHIDPANGDDANDGLTPEHPLRNYASRQYTGGDSVLFKRGSVIRGILQPCNGRENAPVIYGAYGEGDTPAFLGSVSANTPGAWQEERPSVWRCTQPPSSEVCNIVFDKGKSCGILRWQKEDLHQPGDWHYTRFGSQFDGGGDLFLFSEGNPGEVYSDIECVLWGQRKLAGGQSHIVLQDVSFRNSGVHGYQESGPRNVVIRNCEFRFIGGAVWDVQRRIRFGNAVELWDGASDVVVENCVFDEIYDSAVTHQGGQLTNIPERVYFRNNLFVRCGLAAYESREPSQEIYFEHNTCVDAGGGFSAQGENPPRSTDPYPQPVGYHVWAWMIEPNTQPGNVYVRHNIFCGSTGPAVCLSIAPEDADKFQLDYNCYWKSDSARLIEWAGEKPYLQTEFARYQAECVRDQNGRVAEPSFVDPEHGDYRQRPDSPCRDAGMAHGL